MTELCQCINASASKGGAKVRCTNKAKPGTEFCGIHKKCTVKYAVPLPVTVPALVPAPAAAIAPPAASSGQCQCTNQSATKKAGVPVRCTLATFGSTNYCKLHAKCATVFLSKQPSPQQVVSKKPKTSSPQSVVVPPVPKKPKVLKIATKALKLAAKAAKTPSPQIAVVPPVPKKPKALKIATKALKIASKAAKTPSPQRAVVPKSASPVLPGTISPTLKRSLPENLLSIDSRLKLAKYFLDVVEKDKLEQCLVKGELLDSLEITKRLGEGSFGNVFRGVGCIKKNRACQMTFAIKQGKTTLTTLRNSYSSLYEDWGEVLILRDIALPLIVNRATQNLPILYKTFTCESCDFTFAGKVSKRPCFINMMELASGDLTEVISKADVEDDIVLSMLFQVMSGLYAIQKGGQVFNNDIKAANILFYRVPAGGYWEYNIMNKTYYVPNFGIIPVVNDFGVSRTYDPRHPSIYKTDTGSKPGGNAGQRPIMVVDGRITYFSAKQVSGKLPSSEHNVFTGKKYIRTPRYFIVNTDKKRVNVVYHAILDAAQSEFMKSRGIQYEPIEDRFYDPDIVPPGDFVYDVIDAINLFIGGVQRATQDGNHPGTRVSDELKSLLRKYTLVPEMKSEYFSNVSKIKLHHINAGYFIDTFFPKEVDSYLVKPPGAPIDRFDTSAI